MQSANIAVPVDPQVMNTLQCQKNLVGVSPVLGVDHEGNGLRHANDWKPREPVGRNSDFIPADAILKAA